MKELYNSAARKLKRAAFLSAAVAEKTEEIAANREKAAAIRKKNGRDNRAENDVRLYNLNALISGAEKSVRTAKTEIKELKESALSALLDAYPLAETEEHKNKIRAAVGYATDKKAEIADAETAGGVFGETEIIGIITTKDGKNKGTAR